MNARRIALLACLLAAGAGIVVGAPVLAEMLKGRDARALEAATRATAARYASGLSPCQPSEVQWLAQMPHGTADQGAIVVWRVPSFSTPSASRIVGGRLVLSQFMPVAAADNAGGVFQIAEQGTAALDAAQEQRLRAVLSDYVSHAATPNLQGLDGTFYYFQVPGVGCGATWSPEESTRAGRLVALADALSQYASAGGHGTERIESALRALEQR